MKCWNCGANSFSVSKITTYDGIEYPIWECKECFEDTYSLIYIHLIDGDKIKEEEIVLEDLVNDYMKEDFYSKCIAVDDPYRKLERLE